MKYEYNGLVYNDNVFVDNDGGDILDLLSDLEEKGEIEVQTIRIYNIKNCDGYYNDDSEIDDFIEQLVEYDVIAKID